MPAPRKGGKTAHPPDRVRHTPGCILGALPEVRRPTGESGSLPDRFSVATGDRRFFRQHTRHEKPDSRNYCNSPRCQPPYRSYPLPRLRPAGLRVDGVFCRCALAYAAGHPRAVHPLRTRAVARWQRATLHHRADVSAGVRRATLRRIPPRWQHTAGGGGQRFGATGCSVNERRVYL